MIVEFRNSSIDFPDSINVADQEFIIEVIIAKKRSSSVAVKENKLVFRMSSSLSKKQLQLDFDELLKKIVQKIMKKPLSVKVKTFDQVLEEGRFEFAGDIYFLTRINSGRGVKLVENAFVIAPSVTKENLKKHIIRLLQERYFPRLKEYVYAYNESTYQYPIKDFELKLVDSKWGHCSHDNSIMLNLKLLNAPAPVLDYVIAHELSHIKHKNHSASFWREVSRFCPLYKNHRNYLKEKPPGLFA